MEPDKPRHLLDETAMMPAIPRAPKHSADDPDRRGTPYLDTAPVGPQPKTLPPVSPRVRHVTPRAPWWKRWIGIG